jgi:hypothetical protein
VVSTLSTAIKPFLYVENHPDSLLIYRKGQSEPILVQNALSNSRPYIHPIVAPDGAGVLTENEPTHHPWQHGLYVGLNAVNGIGFWSEGLGGNKELEGTFHPRPLESAHVMENRASWNVHAEWRDPRGVPMLQEQQNWFLTDLGDRYELDLSWQLIADIDLTFGQSAYGGLFIRMPYRQERGGEVCNSEGNRNLEAEAKRARWVAVSMPIEGRDNSAGVAILDHSSNPEHPVPWRVDRELGISPSCCIAGEWKLSKGESTSFKHRIVVFGGEAQPALIEESWNLFCGRVK